MNHYIFGVYNKVETPNPTPDDVWHVEVNSNPLVSEGSHKSFSYLMGTCLLVAECLGADENLAFCIVEDTPTEQNVYPIPNKWDGHISQFLKTPEEKKSELLETLLKHKKIVEELSEQLKTLTLEVAKTRGA